MKPKIVTHKGTVPIDVRDRRSKPFRLRVTIGGRRIEKYFKTRAEAEAEWINLAPLASRLREANADNVKTLVDEHEAAQYVCLRALLAGAGLSMADAVQLALKHEDNKRSTATQDGSATPSLHKTPTFIDQINLIAAAIQSPSVQISLADQVRLVSDEVRKISQRIKTIEDAAVVRPRTLRSIKDAARYCGFGSSESFTDWATRVGFEIPKTRLLRSMRCAFLIEDLDHALLNDPAVCRNRRNTPR
jgi:hypothetical protein